MMLMKLPKSKKNISYIEENNPFYDFQEIIIYHRRHIAISKNQYYLEPEQDIEKVVKCNLFLQENQNDDTHKIIEKDYCSNKYFIEMDHFVQADHHLYLEEQEQK